MGWLKFVIVQIVLFSQVFSFADEPNLVSPAEPNLEQAEQEKTIKLREVAQNWICVGIAQYKRELYLEAEKSLLTARGYQEYLTAEEHKQLEEYLAKSQKAAAEKQKVLEQIDKARELLEQGQPIKARAHYEKVRNSPYLTEQQRKQIARELKNIDASFDRQTKEITELYNHSVQFYRQGQLEKAREGFVEVAKYGLLVVPEGQSAEDYLVQIDSVLTRQLSSESSSTPQSAIAPPADENEKTPPVGLPSPRDSELEMLQPGFEQTPEKQQDVNQQFQSLPEEIAEIKAAAEPMPHEPVEVAPVKENQQARINIIRSYTKAIVDDTSVKVGYYIGRGELDKAVDAVRKASEVIRENRSLIGDELFAQYTIRLKQLADTIIQAHRKS